MNKKTCYTHHCHGKYDIRDAWHLQRAKNQISTSESREQHDIPCKFLHNLCRISCRILTLILLIYLSMSYNLCRFCILPYIFWDNIAFRRPQRGNLGKRIINQVELEMHSSQIINLLFLTDLTNLTDSASALRPRLSASPSLFNRMASTSVSKCSSWDLWDLWEITNWLSVRNASQTPPDL